MLRNLFEELDSVIARDPAAGGRLSVLFLYPSVHVMLAYRLAHKLWRWRMRFIARFIMQVARWLTGIEIHPAATIGKRFFIDHGMGVVIGETTTIGNDVTFYHGVTMGGVLPSVDSDSQRHVKRHPTIGDDVIVGAGAQILGPITVNRCARVGANSVVVKDVAVGITVTGIPARAISAKKPGEAPVFNAYGTPVDGTADARDRAITGLLDEVQSLRSRLNALEDNLDGDDGLDDDDRGDGALTEDTHPEKSRKRRPV
ncbi:MAG: serine O-acetyltransferase [Alphaproteobacteria bacterium]|nr:serine O-acetyltransferase [Alphaproteobacteria bacterium]